MSVELKVPEVGESVNEVYIGKWYKSEGDKVDQDEQVVELESEKATLDLRAPAAGVLAKILKKTGDAAEVGEVIGRIEETDGKKPREKGESQPKLEQKPKTEERPKAALEEKPATKKQEEPEAKERKEKISGEPPGLSRRDKPAGSQASESVSQEELPAKETAEEVEQRVEPTRREERVPMSPVRRRIAMRLVEAQQNAALLTTFNEIDMTAVKELRAQLGETFQQRHGIRLGFMSFFVKATIDALQQLPELNAMIDGDEIVYRRYFDIGVAISTDRGLVVPVLRDADRLSFAEIEKAIDDFA
ncbi:MAG: 2-oxo acid dehydrogenase subunit E2, partial [Pirellulales bacterium]